MELNTEAINAISTGFQALFLEGFGAVKPTWQKYCLEVESKGDRETYEIPDGMGEMEEWVGPRNIRTLPDWTQTLRNKDYEHTFAVPVNRIKDDRLGTYPQQVKLQGMVAAGHPDKLVADSLIGGFTAVGYDGVAFFHASHPRSDGNVQPNRVTGALSSTTFRTAVAQMDAMTDYFGRPLNLRGMGLKRKLVVGPSLRATARAICDLPTLSSGAANPDYQEAETELNPYLIGDYAAYWYVVCTGGPIFPFILQMREKPEQVSTMSPDHPEVLNNKRVLFGVQGRWAVGPGFFQLIQGSTGT